MPEIVDEVEHALSVELPPCEGNSIISLGNLIYKILTW